MQPDFCRNPRPETADAAAGARPKIFLIGFNKCGTSSFHFMFRKSGIASAHFGGADKDSNIALKIYRNVMLARPVLTGLEEYDALSDISFCDTTVYIEGGRFFRNFYAEYPDAYFILNTRDRDNWLRSRIAHGSRSGGLLRRSAEVYRCDKNGVVELWKEQFAAHEADVAAFFADRPGSRFLRFDIETGKIARVAAFLRPAFSINTRWWQKRNETPDTARSAASDRLRPQDAP